MDARIHDVGKFFYSPMCLVVPVYQRPYVWDQDAQWKPLWEDIQRLAEQILQTGRAKPHFMGAVVVDFAPGYTGTYVHRSIVVDGQQRLTTIHIVLEALADNYECLRDGGCEEARLYADRARMITRNQNLKDHEESDEFKVWPMNLDQSAFKAVMHAGSPAQLADQHNDNPEVLNSRIASAYVYFYERIHEWLHGQVDLARAIAVLYDVIDQYMQVVVIDLQNSVDPQLIFETLNARGTPLAPSDLIKNFLFYQAQLETGDGTALYAKHWQPFEDDHAYWSAEIGKGNARRTRLDVFVHHYLTMKKREEVSVRKLYLAYREFADTTELTTVQQLEELAYYGQVYKQLDYLPEGSREATFIYRTRLMDVATVMPLVLAVMGDRTLMSADRAEIFGIVESYLIRRMLCHMTGKAYNRIFVDLLKATESTGLSPESVRSTLASWTEDTYLWPDDDRLKAAWMGERAYGWLAQARVRMVLEALEPVIRSDKAENIKISEALTIEHLLPQSWQSNYPLPTDGSVDEWQRERLLHTWGNLTLLTRKLNPSVSNGAWSTADDLADDKGKRAQILSHSGIAINRMLAQYRSWDETAIQERGALLLEAALQLWPRPAVVVSQEAA